MTTSRSGDHDTLVIGDATLTRSTGSTRIDVTVRDGLITAVEPADAGRHPVEPNTIDAAGALISPGLIDLHLHGGFGSSFGDGDPEQIRTLTEGLARRGISTVQASLVSLSTPRLAAMINFLADRLGPKQGRTAIAGIHLEGPFLSRQQAGAHDPETLRSPSHDDLELLLRHGDAVSMITIAPEVAGVEELITRCTQRGILTAIGHSNGEQRHFDRAVAAGSSHVTHLWSGQSNLTRKGPWRVPGMVEASLASGLTAEIIADGRHLPLTLLEIARRCVGERLVVVSDATAGAGMPEGYRYPLGTVQCRVADGVGMVEGKDVFGGSTTLLDEMLRYLVGLGWPLHEVLPMMTSTPAAILGRRDLGVLAPGARADLVLWNPDLTARQVIIGGRVVG